MSQKIYWSLFDIFKIGIGPSSSHTVGPMKASLSFIKEAKKQALLEKTQQVRVILHGSLSSTGKGHGTDKAVIAGLSGLDPETVAPEEINALYQCACEEHQLSLHQEKTISFSYEQDIIFDNIPLQFHPNALSLFLLSAEGKLLLKKVYYSIGGGFIKEETPENTDNSSSPAVPYPFDSCEELLLLSEKNKIPFSEIILQNELVFRSRDEISAKVKTLWDVMQSCIEKGCQASGVLPGPMQVPRRAPTLFQRLSRPQTDQTASFFETCDWINLYAIAVSEENASGGRIVTSPTNGAAGIIPSVLTYCKTFIPGFNEEKILRFLLTATAIAILFKKNASISGAEVGCQGEIGSACSMAAAGLCEIMGGPPKQVENAAEIAIEHNLGLTCDPIGGVVQIPCIERNAIASVKAVNAARLALNGTGTHTISLDSAIETMRQTGLDMMRKYKETSEGGLAIHFRRPVNRIDC